MINKTRLQMVDGGDLIESAVTGFYSGVEEVWIDAGAMLSSSISGATATGFYQNGLSVDAYDFNSSGNRYCEFKLSVPSNWNKGDLKAKFYWTAASGSGNAVWSIQAGCLNNDSIITGNWGSQSDVADSFITGYDTHISSAATFSISGGENDSLSYFRIFRNASATGDTLTTNSLLLGAKIQYGTSGSIESW